MKRMLTVFLLVVTALQMPCPLQARPGHQQVCSEIAAVRHIPFHPEDKVDDPAYSRLREKSWGVVPCLISQITNTSLTPDPRSAPVYPKVRVGDVAFWVVKDITGLPYDEMFPEGTRRRFKQEGVYAYFEWVNRDGHRKKLQQNVDKWFSLHRPKELQ
jgi:hypothetical protein